MIRQSTSYRRLWYVKKRNLGLFRTCIRIAIAGFVLYIFHWLTGITYYYF